MITITNLLLSILFLIVLPICIGNTICYVLKQHCSFTKCFITGYITMWAVCQLVAVPLILLKQSFLAVVGVLSFAYGILILYSFLKKDIRNGYKKLLTDFRLKDLEKDDNIKSKKILDTIAFLIMILAVLFIALASIFLQHTDADDSRFVVNAVDIYRTNRLLLTDVNSGNPISAFIGDLNKDVTSPWPVFMAYVSKLTGVYPSIMMHTVFPPVLMLMLGAIYWIISEHFFEGESFYRCMFVCFALLLIIYGYHSIYTSETFILIRMWQGKAVVAGIGIPIIIWRFLELYKKQSKGNYMLLFMANLGICVLSSMGIIIGGIMLGCYGLVYGIVKKNWKLMAAVWMMCLINAFYLGLSYIINIRENEKEDIYIVTQYGNYELMQHMFYTIEDKDNNLIIIDGGWDFEADLVREVIAQHNNHVTAWIITHPHPDHAGAFNVIAENYPEITIDDIYTVDVNYERYKETAHDYDMFEVCEKFTDITSGLNNVHYVKEGDIFTIIGLEFDVIHAWDAEVDQMMVNLANNGSMCFTVKGREDKMLFCADTQKEVEEEIIAEHKDELDVDYVQLGHHGNWGMTPDFYDMIEPKAVFFDATRGIFESEGYDASDLKDYFDDRDIPSYTYITSPNTIEIR